VRFDSRVDRPDALAVRAGLFGRRLLLISVDDVAEIIPRETRIVLRAPPTPIASEAAETGEAAK
jgi:hypothetical protein